MTQTTGVQVGRVCPQCGQENSVPLWWGLPSAGAFRLAERGSVSLGGCVLMREAPDFCCRSCGLQWGRESDPTTDELALAELLGLPHAQIVRMLGRGWRRENDATGDEDLQWFTSGEPVQVAIGVSHPWLLVAHPLRREEDSPDSAPAFRLGEIRWGSPDVARAVEAVATRRRRSFRWCPVCRRPSAPEDFDTTEAMCQACSRAYDDLGEPGGVRHPEV